ncbi:hypothetical protein SO802_012394 [Lithocarpus litseifolius]|uniref:Uncharacterized protein n=1 Tax=Lithocarpus litseifolius TaxID=425828 RepID=A0AAW2D2L6_9ROSI
MEGMALKLWYTLKMLWDKRKEVLIYKRLVPKSKDIFYLKGIIAPSKSRKHVPTPIWVREKGKRLIKIKDTHQEETMNTSVEDSIAQKILKALDEHGEALKKMGGHLTRLEESKLKKSSHVEINDDEEEVEEWDEKDKAEYERNKQFEKLTIETMAMREKMEKMKLAFHKAQRMDDYHYNIGENLNEYCHYHQKSSHKADNCFCLKHEIQDLIDNGTLPNPNIITKPNIRKNPLPNYHRAPPPYRNWVQIDEIKWDCSKLIEAKNINVNAMEVHGIWDEEDETLKEAVVV